MAYIDDVIERVKTNSALSDFKIISAKNGKKINFPVTEPVLSLSCEVVSRDFPLGSDCGAFISENIIAEVLVSENMGGKYCLECAETAAFVLIGCDVEKRIIGIKSEKCIFDQLTMTWKVVMTIELSCRYTENGGE